MTANAPDTSISPTSIEPVASSQLSYSAYGFRSTDCPPNFQRLAMRTGSVVLCAAPSSGNSSMGPEMFANGRLYNWHPMEGQGNITEILQRFASGERSAGEELMPLVYNELKRLAISYLRRERPGHTLQATALVHEAYLRLIPEHGAEWNGRAHFFAFAARLMRQILTDHARRRNAGKRGAGAQMVAIQEGFIVTEAGCAFLPDLDEALDRLSAIDPRSAQIVEMRFFGGMKEEEIAEVLGLSVRTVRRTWAFARAWLHGELKSH